MATARTAPAASEAAGATPDFEVVGDQLVCHPFDDLRLSLVIPMASFDRYDEINRTSTGWMEQFRAWREIMPPEVVETIDRESARDFAAGTTLARQWAKGIDVRLGKALS